LLATFPIGSVRYESEIDAKGNRETWLEPGMVDITLCARPARATATRSSGWRVRAIKGSVILQNRCESGLRSPVDLSQGSRRRGSADQRTLKGSQHLQLPSLPNLRAKVRYANE
jgi:hypothetical protein